MTQQQENTQQDTTQLVRVADRTNKKVFFKKRQGCPLFGYKLAEINYKNPDLLSKFISEGGRILPSRITGVCIAKQRRLKRAIKIARILSLLPFVFKLRK